jgi:hypothetical protein
VAYRRKSGVRAAEEEKMSRPFNAWLPVALLDGAFVVMNVAAAVITRGD